MQTNNRFCSLTFDHIGKFENVPINSEYKLEILFNILKPRYAYDSMEDVIVAGNFVIKIQPRIGVIESGSNRIGVRPEWHLLKLVK
jgi:hypothetical protein